MTTTVIRDDFEHRYRRLFGCRAGYLPRDLKSLNPWFRRLEKPGAIRRFTVRPPRPDKCIDGSTIDVNAQIAVAR